MHENPAVIATLLPDAARSAEAFGDPPEAVLLPEEEPLVARAVDKRRREVTTARWCARRALAELGVPPAPVPRGERGEPVWPDGVVGSLTHCDGYRAAVVGRAEQVLTVGIDAEPDGPLPDGVLDVVSLPAERARLTELSTADPSRNWDRLLFCCKESVYKAWFPLTREWLGFEDARIDVDPAAGTFTAHLLRPAPEVGGAPLTGFSGRWTTGRGLVVAAIVRQRT
ncbi:4'-phosphopantetheinyl transferase family protein [Saccharopolyspora rosea]|uniref:4'-phosphopantetheinyl transferase n=1 Tax=Saccharopolyspora rosea TaxID=524884 RepID=A0ABW3FUA7_9PSEU|nr:4'-phosphopantetheinyl transferase superfamily protein [Saccharopolyspora rosea]